MPINPMVVNELRAMFKAGTTVSALIHRITEHHGCDSRVDALVRDYFREAFHVPMIRVGSEQIRHIAQGGNLPALNLAVVHRIIQTRNEWDQSDLGGSQNDRCWLDGVAATDEAVLNESAQPESVPELANSWDRLDDEAKQFIKRLMGNSHALHERANILAVLVEQIQQQASSAVARTSQVA